MFIRPMIALAFLTATAAWADDTTALNHHCPAAGWESRLVIDVLAVAQGDSTFIRTPGGTTVLIDGGGPGHGEADILPTLKKCYGVRSLDYVMLTHPHADHFGGLAAVLGALPVNQAVYDTGNVSNGGQAFGKYRAAAEATGKRRTPELGDAAFVTKDPVKFRVIAANGKILGGKSVEVFARPGVPKDKNAVSIALLVTYGEFRYFTGGDLSGGGSGTPDVETPVADAVGPVSVMKSDHHGSNTANNEYLLEKLHPANVIVSVGDGGSNKRYHLPNVDFIAETKAMPYVQNIFQTAKGLGRAPASDLTKVRNENGDVVIVASPDSYSIDGQAFPLH